MHMMTNHDSSAIAAKKRNERTCAGCGKHAPAEELVRVVHDPGSGAIAVDLAGRMPRSAHVGRGAHVHPARDCVAKAVKSGFARSFKAKIVADAATVAADIVSAADRRIEGLLSGARRAGELALGADAVAVALREGRAQLVVVARDAAAAARIPEVERAVASGRAVALGDKQRLGALAARPELAVLAVLHPGVADAVARTHRAAEPFRTLGPPGGRSPEESLPANADARSEEAWSSPEVQ